MDIFSILFKLIANEESAFLLKSPEKMSKSRNLEKVFHAFLKPPQKCTYFIGNR